MLPSGKLENFSHPSFRQLFLVAEVFLFSSKPFNRMSLRSLAYPGSDSEDDDSSDELVESFCFLLLPSFFLLLLGLLLGEQPKLD